LRHQPWVDFRHSSGRSVRLHLGDLRANHSVFGAGTAASTEGNATAGLGATSPRSVNPVPDVEHVAPRAGAGESPIAARLAVDAIPAINGRLSLR
jgi:hypothetical protein